MTTVTVLDAPAGVSEANSARGTAAMLIVIAANAEPTRKLGFCVTRSFTALPRKLQAMDHHGIPSSKRTEVSTIASSLCRDRQCAG
jgi:hypothetical protein